jgi:hypothetical protein
LPPTGIHLWCSSTVGDGNLGLCCNRDGLFLGRTPLTERCASGYALRTESDLERLFKCSLVGADLGRMWRRLGVVKSALDEGNFPLAQIAAVQLRVPDLSGFRGRAPLEAEDPLIKAESGGDLLSALTGIPTSIRVPALRPIRAGSPRPMDRACRARRRSPKARKRSALRRRCSILRGRYARRGGMRGSLSSADWTLITPTRVYRTTGTAQRRGCGASRRRGEEYCGWRIGQIAHGHAWKRRASEFPEVSTQSQFSRVIQRVVSDPSSVIKPLDRGRTAFFEARQIRWWSWTQNHRIAAPHSDPDSKC